MSTKESLSTQFARGSKECAKTHILIHSGERDWPDWPSFELELDPYFRPSKNHQMDRVRLAPSLLQIPHRFSSGERLQLGNIDICGASLSIQPPPPNKSGALRAPPQFLHHTPLSSCHPTSPGASTFSLAEPEPPDGPRLPRWNRRLPTFQGLKLDHGSLALLRRHGSSAAPRVRFAPFAPFVRSRRWSTAELVARLLWSSVLCSVASCGQTK